MNRIVNTMTDGAQLSTVTELGHRGGWHHRGSLSAVLIGAGVALTVGVALTALGAAIGTGLVDTVHRDTPSATTMTTAAGAWLLASHVVALFVGGLVAGRLSGAWSKQDGALHGLGVWGLASIFSVMLLGSVAGSVTGAVGTAVGGVASGAASAAGSAIGAAAPAVDPRELANRAQAALSAPEEPARMNSDQRKAAIAQIVAKRVGTGAFADADRTRMNQLVAAEAGMSPEEADRRVRAYEADAQRVARETEETARQAADTAAKAASISAWWFFGTMALGGLAAFFGAGRGAEREREDNAVLTR